MKLITCSRPKIAFIYPVPSYALSDEAYKILKKKNSPHKNRWLSGIRQKPLLINI